MVRLCRDSRSIYILPSWAHCEFRLSKFSSPCLVQIQVECQFHRCLLPYTVRPCRVHKMLPYFHSSKSGTQSSVQAAAHSVQAGAECQFRCYHRAGDLDVEIPPKRCSTSTHPSLAQLGRLLGCSIPSFICKRKVVPIISMQNSQCCIQLWWAWTFRWLTGSDLSIDIYNCGKMD